MQDAFQDLALTVPSRPAGDLEDEQMLAKHAGHRSANLTVVHADRTAARMLGLTVSAAGMESMQW